MDRPINLLGKRHTGWTLETMPDSLILSPTRIQTESFIGATAALLDNYQFYADAFVQMGRHLPIPEQGKWLRYVVNGHFNYHAVPTNGQALHVFRHQITDL
jgi:hypothetical protein